MFLRETFPKLKIIPTDKMSPVEATEYLRKGAYAVAPIIDLEMIQHPRGLIVDFKKI